MELSREEKKEIEKRDKELRRSMWEEKPPSSGVQEKKPEKVSTSSQATGRQSERTRLNAKGIARKDKANTAPGTDHWHTPKVTPKTGAHKQGAWQSHSGVHSHQRSRWGATNGKAGKYWNAPQPKKIKTPFRWKLALGVLGVVFALILVGVGLGYFFAR